MWSYLNHEFKRDKPIYGNSLSVLFVLIKVYNNRFNLIIEALILMKFFSVIQENRGRRTPNPE